MTFEEQFPSFTICYKSVDYEEPYQISILEACEDDFIHILDMKEHCRDKQRIKEAIAKIAKEHGCNTEGRWDDEGEHILEETAICWECKLIEELDLED